MWRRNRASILRMMISSSSTIWLRGTAVNHTGGSAGSNGCIEMLRVRHRGLQSCQVGLWRLPRIHEFVFRVHCSVVGLLRAVTTRTTMGATIGEDDWHIKHVHRLSRQKGAFRRDRFGLIEPFHIIIQQVLVLPSVSHTFMGFTAMTYIVPVGGPHLKTSRAPLRFVGPITHDVRKCMTSAPLTRSHTLIPVHGVSL